MITMMFRTMKTSSAVLAMLCMVAGCAKEPPAEPQARAVKTNESPPIGREGATGKSTAPRESKQMTGTDNAQLAAVFTDPSDTDTADSAHAGRPERRPANASPPVEKEIGVKGELSKDTIRRVIHRHVNEIPQCIKQYMPGVAANSGKVTIKFIIAGDGNVQMAAIADSAQYNAAAQDCIAAKAKRWQFPQPKDGGIVIVTYPVSWDGPE